MSNIVGCVLLFNFFIVGSGFSATKHFVDIKESTRLLSVLDTPKKILDFMVILEPTVEMISFRNFLKQKVSNQSDLDAKIVVQNSSIVIGGRDNSILIESDNSISFRQIKWKLGTSQSVENSFKRVQEIWKLKNKLKKETSKYNFFIGEARAQPSTTSLAEVYLGLIPTFVEWAANSGQFLNFYRLVEVQRFLERNSILKDVLDGSIKFPVRLECGSGLTRAHKLVLAGERSEVVLEMKIQGGKIKEAFYDSQKIIVDSKFLYNSIRFEDGKTNNFYLNTAIAFEKRVRDLDQFCAKPKEVFELNRKLKEMDTSLLQKQFDMIQRNATPAVKVPPAEGNK